MRFLATRGPTDMVLNMFKMFLAFMKVLSVQKRKMNLKLNEELEEENIICHATAEMHAI